MIGSFDDPWPWHSIPDGQGGEDQCTHCMAMFREEGLTAMKDVQNRQQYVCEACQLELENDFEGDEE